MALSVFTLLCSHHHYSSLEVFLILNWNYAHWTITPHFPLPPSPWQQPFCFSDSIIWTIGSTSYAWKHTIFASFFCTWLFHLRYKHLNAEFQRIARRDKKAFLSDQCKEIEENNRMGKNRDLFKKIRDTKGTFLAKMGSIKDRNGMDLTEAEDIIEEVARIHRRTVEKRSSRPR